MVVPNAAVATLRRSTLGATVPTGVVGVTMAVWRGAVADESGPPLLTNRALAFVGVEGRAGAAARRLVERMGQGQLAV